MKPESAVTLVFPHQLFKEHPALQQGRKVILTEEFLFFSQYNFHKRKIIFHRASMQFYKAWLEEKKYAVEYIHAQDERNDVRKLIASLAENNVAEIYYADTVDNWLEKRLKENAAQFHIKLYKLSTPCFINTLEDANVLFADKKKYFQTDFYIHERKRLGILINKDLKPEGGKWSFDEDNRKKITKTETLTEIDFPQENIFYKEAEEYVEKYFKNNYGIENDKAFFTFGNFPCTFNEAKKWLDDFFKTRFKKFGEYEDAIIAEEHILFHSSISMLLNVGLLTPKYVVDKTLKAAEEYKIPLNSVEGFIRQIIGWREFIRIVYEREGTKQRTKNYWNFTRKIPAAFWKAQTGIEPLDTVIKKVLQTGYCHHIERLMVLANFMLLCEFNPDEVYKWFMELFIDAYDWVMVPNVYGMTQFADGGLMATKPYISSSNYILKMSNYKKGKWCEIWDALFWRFMKVHREFFSSNPRLSMLLNSFDKMDKVKQKSYLQTAENYLQSLSK